MEKEAFLLYSGEARANDEDMSETPADPSHENITSHPDTLHHPPLNAHSASRLSSNGWERMDNGVSCHLADRQQKRFSSESVLSTAFHHYLVN